MADQPVFMGGTFLIAGVDSTGKPVALAVDGKGRLLCMAVPPLLPDASLQLPEDLVNGRLPVDGSGVTQPVLITNGLSLKTAVLNHTVTGVVVPAVPGKRIKVYGIILDTLGTISVGFRSGASSMLQGMMPYAAKVGYIAVVSPPTFILATAVGDSLTLVISGSGTVSGHVIYWDDDVS